MFYIPFNEKNVRDVLEQFDYQYKGLSLAIAVAGYAERFYGQFTYRVYNLDEWLHEDFDDVLGANQGGFLRDKTTGRVVTEGAVQRYIMNKQAKRETAERDFKQFKEQQTKKK